MLQPAIPVWSAFHRRCTRRFVSWRGGKPPATTTVSSIAILPGVRWRRVTTMAPDADAGKAPVRSDPFAPLTSQRLPVGDGHEIYVESVGRADGIPAVYLHGGPGSGCQPDHRRLFDPERFHAVLFDQRGAGRSRPKGRREDNTLPHLIADMEMIREQFGISALDDRRRLLGRDTGAGLCAGAPEPCQRHRAARDLSRHRARSWKARFSTRCRASIPISTTIFSACCRRRARATARCLLTAAFSIPIPRCMARPRAPGTTPNGSFPNMPRRVSGSIRGAELDARAARHAVHGSALFPE